MDEQIMQALEKIQKICENNGCDDCEFNLGGGDCGFEELRPTNWSLNKPGEKYKYFR